MPSVDGCIAKNLRRAAGLVDRAARRGAQLILLPELMPTGYTYSRKIWRAAEPGDGPTVCWLRSTSERHRVWLGTSFLEASGRHFYNTFVLTGPDGEIAGRVRKQQPALWEACFFAGKRGSHVIETPIGRIGVGICYENRLAFLPALMKDVDIMLMPHSAPSPPRTPMFRSKDVREYDGTLKDLARRYASLLGVPTVMANKCGVWRSPVPWIPSRTFTSTFSGQSTIADSDGHVRAQLTDREGIIVQDVMLDPGRKKDVEVPTDGRWAWTAPRWAAAARLIEAAGGLRYRLSPERGRSAARMSSRPGVKYRGAEVPRSLAPK